MANNKKSARKYAAVALGLVGIAGLSLASAAQLTVNEDSPLVGVSTGAECDDAVNVSYTTDFNNGAFAVKTVEVSDIDVNGSTGCVGRDLTVYVLNGSGAELTSVTAEITGGTLSLPVTAAVDAELVYNAAVAIN